MSGIRGRDTKPEILVRKGLHSRGFRFRLHSSKVPGKPDLVLPRYRVALFVHGCFWHSHDCHLFRMPSTRPEFWKAKLRRNRERDEEVRTALLSTGWRVLVIWECAMKGKNRIDMDELLDDAAEWIRGSEREGTIEGRRS